MLLSVVWQKFSDSGGTSVNFYKTTGLASPEEYNLKIFPAILCGVE
jgi:hypothetical protein